MKAFRISARGAGAELVAAPEVEKLGVDVKRQVKMGTSDIDFSVNVGGKVRGVEVKGWTPETWDDALESAMKRLNKKKLTAADLDNPKKIDRMLNQMNDIKTATGKPAFLGVSDRLSASSRSKLSRVLRDSKLGETKLLDLGEDAIKEAAAETIGEKLGIPRP
jgi:hypothetical protein